MAGKVKRWTFSGTAGVAEDYGHIELMGASIRGNARELRIVGQHEDAFIKLAGWLFKDAVAENTKVIRWCVGCWEEYTAPFPLDEEGCCSSECRALAAVKEMRNE